MTARHVVRGRLLSFENGPDRPWYVEDGFLLIEDGVIAARGDLVDMPAADVPVTRYDGDLVMAGLIDTHIHYPQTQVIASYGAQLLDWLQRYTFVEEQRFADPAHAAAVAGFFLEELFRNGTTTAAVYCTVHANSVDAFFEASSARNSRMIAGKVMMDRGAPDGLLDTAERGHRESAAAIARWHGRGRQRYAVTPRFAPTSSEPQLEAAGDLLRAYPDCYLQTHLSENRDEIRAVAGLFPWSANYTQVYERFGLLGPRSIFGHCIHLSAAERRLLAESGSIAAFCPTSNLFIGSGLFDRRAMMDAGVTVSLATDVGGGTSYSMLRTAAEAYKILQLQGQNLPSFDAFHMMTAGNALALGLQDEIGTLEVGTAADLTVLRVGATAAMAHRMARVENLEQELFVLMTMGDDRAVRATWVAGVPVYTAEPQPQASA